MKNRYEGLLVLNQKGNEDTVKDLIERIEGEFEKEGAKVEQVQKMWGDRAALAAEIHIKRDCGVVPSEQDAQMVALFGANAVTKKSNAPNAL